LVGKPLPLSDRVEIDIVEASPTKIERLIIRSSETPASSLAVGLPA